MSNDPEYYELTENEMRARSRRNIALALVLAGFMVFVFVTMIIRVGAI